jgi:hypothetical protein
METKILKHLITTLINKKFRNPEKQRNFLIDCIESNGYILKKEESKQDEEIDDYEDLYQYMIPSSSEQNSSNSYVPEFQQSIAEQAQSSVDPYGFNRTFINVNSHASDKLAELQKRGITYEETQFIKVKEQMEEIINSALPSSDFTNKILQTALNIYLNIIIYYKTNNFNFTEMKGSLKKGYIFLCLYYSLIYNNNFIEKETLMDHSGSIRLKDLPVADKNIKLIFNGIKGYSFMYSSFHGSINPKQFLSKTININKSELLICIENVIEETKNIVPSTKLGIYAIIYFVCNNYYKFRVKIKYKDTETFVTYKILNEMFEPFASATVRKITDQLRTFFKKG